MSHRNARLNPTRAPNSSSSGFEIRACLFAHVAKANGKISRQCAHRWVRRFDEEGLGRTRGPFEPNLIVRLGAPTPRRERRVLAAPPKAPLRPSPTGPPERGGPETQP